MGEQDHALHEIADARARLSELADELARHAQPERVKELAAEKVGEWKERAKELASEKAVELKEQAKEAVMHKTIEVKDKVDTPRGWSLLGAIIGAGVGGLLMKKAFAIRQERSIGEGSKSTAAAGMSGDISAMGGDFSNVGTVTHTDVNLRERAADVVQTVKDKASNLRERIPSGSELKGRTSDWFDRAVENQPLMLALGSMALGVFASLLIPVSSRERQLIEPAKRKAQEGLSQLGEQLEHRIQGQEVSQGAGTPGTSGASMNTGSSYQGDVGAMRSSTLGAMDRSEDLMGAERPGFDGSGSRIPPPPPLDDVSTKIH